MMDLGAKFSGSGDWVVEFCAQIMAGAKAYLLSSERRCFLGWEMEESCVKEALPDLVEVHAPHVFSTEIH